MNHRKEETPLLHHTLKWAWGSRGGLREWTDLVAPPEVRVLHECPVPQLSLVKVMRLRVQDVLEEDVHVVEVLVSDLLKSEGRVLHVSLP